MARWHCECYVVGELAVRASEKREAERLAEEEFKQQMCKSVNCTCVEY